MYKDPLAPGTYLEELLNASSSGYYRLGPLTSWTGKPVVRSVQEYLMRKLRIHPLPFLRIHSQFTKPDAMHRNHPINAWKWGGKDTLAEVITVMSRYKKLLGTTIGFLITRGFLKRDTKKCPRGGDFVMTV